MFTDKETKYWQEEYRKGNLDDMDMSGGILCILDGTVARITKTANRFCLWAAIPMVLMFTLAAIEAHRPALYAELRKFLDSIGVNLGTGCDPIPFLVIEVVVALIVFNVLRRYCTNG